MTTRNITQRPECHTCGRAAPLTRWLVVFDNAEQPAALGEYLPAGPGHVLITSRNPDWYGLATGVEVGQFVRSESVTVLRSRLPDLPAKGANDLAAALGDLPLAVDQAGALLADTGMSVDTYLRLLEQRARQVLAEGRDEGNVSVAASCEVAFDRLASDDLPALQLLIVLAWLAQEPVSLSVLTEHPGLLPAPLSAVAADPLALAQRITKLRRRGMARVTSGSIELHRVPAALLRVRATTPGTGQGEWETTVLGLLCAVVPAAVWGNPPVWPIWRSLLPHVLAVVDSSRGP